MASSEIVSKRILSEFVAIGKLKKTALSHKKQGWVQRGGESEKSPAPWEDSINLYRFCQKMFIFRLNLKDLADNSGDGSKV